MSVNIDQIVVSDKFKSNNKVSKYFIGYQKGEIIKPLCIILPQMSGYMKYFEYGSPNMSFLIKDEEVWEKYDEIWKVIKNKLGIKFHSLPVYDKKYLKTKATCITIDSVMKMDEKYFSQVYLEECKYKIKKIQMSRFINAELDSESDSESDPENDSDNDSDNDFDNDFDNHSDNDFDQ